MVAGVTFGAPKFSATEVTIGDGTVVAVTLENPVTLTPVATTPPVTTPPVTAPPVTTPPAKLPSTGSDALGLAAGAAVLVAAGATAVLIRRRRAQD